MWIPDLDRVEAFLEDISVEEVFEAAFVLSGVGNGVTSSGGGFAGVDLGADAGEVGPSGGTSSRFVQMLLVSIFQ